MCTVTFIGQGKQNFILTSNRDEQAARSPQRITKIEQGQVHLIFPRDTQAGGTWIACSDNDKLVCLLNGAFVRHQRKPLYKKSRGIMVLDFFSFSSSEDFITQYDFDGMESFTMVAWDNGRLFQIVWNEERLFHKNLSTQGKYMWSSTTLYSPKAKLTRQGWFEQWLYDRTDFSLAAIDEFHLNGGFWDTWNGFLMNRANLVQTVSKTNIVRSPIGMEMIYQDFLRNKTKYDALAFPVQA